MRDEVGLVGMRRDWVQTIEGSTPGDSRQAMREWRWRCYLDHLEDLGYELEMGRSEAEPMGPGTGDRAEASAAVR